MMFIRLKYLLSLPLTLRLQIMDAKMDSGYVPPGDTFEPDADFTKPLDAAEALWIVDQLMCLEIAWLDGYPLSQTVFTSLHIDRLLNPIFEDQYTSAFKTGQRPAGVTKELDTVHMALLAYCVGLIKCCDEALNLIQSQNFYEEEDFVTHLFGRELLPKVSSVEALDELIWAQTQFEDGFEDTDVREAIMCQLDFRKTYLRLLSGQSDSLGDPDVEVDWFDFRHDLERVKSYHKFSSPYPTAFSEKVQRQLATSTPPRPMLQISWDLACSKWKSLCEDVIAAHRLTSSEIIPSPAGLHRAIWAFSYREQPCCLARAEIQSIIFTKQAIRDEVPHFQLLMTDIFDLVLAGDSLVDPRSFEVELTSDPRHICSKLMTGFMDNAIEEFLNLYRMVCQNRCRIRRTFTQAIPILDELETIAQTTDQELRKSTTSLTRNINNKTSTLEPLTCWTKFHKLRIMAWTVQLGFETDIYCPDELGSMYWLLAHMSEQRSRLLAHITAFTTDRMRRATNKSVKRECSASADYLTSLHNVAMITLLIADAMSTLYKLLTNVGLITAPKRDFADTSLLYEARMKPFLGIFNDTPPGPNEFEKWRQREDTAANMCVEVNEKIKEAKSLISNTKKMTPEQAKYVGTEDEWTKEWKQTETTCVAISVAVSQLMRTSEKHGGTELGRVMECKPEKKYHEWWVVPLLKEKAKS